MSETLVRDNLVAGDFPVVTDSVTILTGNNLKRGTVLGLITASSKCVAVDSTLSNGAQTPKYVLLEDVDASAADAVGAVGLTGEYDQNSLIFGGTDTATMHKAALRALCIFIKPATAA